MARRAPSPTAADRAKADLLFLEAQRAKALGHFDAAFYLLDAAHTLNPTDREIGIELAPFLLHFQDSVSTERSLNLLADYYQSAPSDYQAGVRLGMLYEHNGRDRDALEVWKKLHSYYPERINVSAMLAAALARTGLSADRERAIAVYDSIEAAEGPSIDLSSAKMQIYYLFDDTAAIKGEADRLLSSRPGSSEFNIFAGDIYDMFGDKERALVFYNRAVELDPANGHAYYAKANYFKAEGDTAAYDNEILKALRQNSLDPDIKLQILRSFIQDTHADSIMRPRISQLFDTLVLQHPGESNIRALYAAWLAEEKMFAAAAEQQEQAVGLDPSDADEWDMLASLYASDQRYDLAIDALNRAIHYHPASPALHYKLGVLIGMNKDYDKAINEFNRALELVGPNENRLRSSIYCSIADNLYSAGQTDSAFTVYNTAIRLDSDNLLALNNAAYFMACSGRDLDLALAMIERVLASDPDNPTDLDTYAWVLFKRKNYAKAREVIDRTLQLATDDSADILEHAGDIYFMDGEPARALEFWTRALELNPDSELLQRKVRDKTFYYE